jgi:hypothetical protein
LTFERVSQAFPDPLPLITRAAMAARDSDTIIAA